MWRVSLSSIFPSIVLSDASISGVHGLEVVPNLVEAAGDKVKLRVYLESQCPFCQEFFTELLYPGITEGG
jgi:hypothetical protein